MFSASKISKPSGGGYTIARSVRLRSSASAYLNRTPATTTNQKTWTWSGWVKRGTLGGTAGTTPYFFTSSSAGTDAAFLACGFNGDQLVVTGYATDYLQTNAVYRDPAAWYHVVIAFDSTQATASNRIKLYVNGVQITSFSTANYVTLNFNSPINLNQAHYIGGYNIGSGMVVYYDGYLTEINFIDGQALTPSSFGSINTTTGVWQPIKYTGTYGTNGFYLNFGNNASTTTLGYDTSGNGNNWTTNNISVTAGVTYDSMTDVPTLTSATAANYVVLNPLFGSTGTITNGNLTLAGASQGYTQRLGTMAVSSGKWYYELVYTSLPAGVDPLVGFTEINNASAVSQYPGQASNSYAIYSLSTNSFLQKVNNSTFTNTATAVAAQGDVVGVAFDLDNGKIWFSKNGVFVDSGNPAAGTNAQYTGITGTYAPAFRTSGIASSTTLDTNFGQRPLTYTPPTGFVALNTQNLPTPTISNGAKYMSATTYAGSASQQVINSNMTALDFAWIKDRTSALSNVLVDTVRGGSPMLTLYSNLTSAEDNASPNYNPTSISGSSITLGGAKSGINNSGDNYVMWGWYTNGGSTSSNTNGSITSTVSVNATAGFSVVTYTGTGANATVGHGLGVAPSMIIVKGRGNVADWIVGHNSLTSWNYVLNLDNTIAQTAYTGFNNTAPTSTVFSLGAQPATNASSIGFVAYCWSQVAGYSAFGSYTGNGSTDGTFVYLGFRPRYLLVKLSSAATTSWAIYDSARDTYNTEQNSLFADSSVAEISNSSNGVDFLSNGFKLRTTNATWNSNGATYIYAAFAENPFKNSLAR